MTSREALERAKATPPEDRQNWYDGICRLRGACRFEKLANDPGRGTWCPDCLTVYDDYGKPVNRFEKASRMN